MSKRNKKIRSNRSTLKLETLEQRQLLATIVAGSGENVENAQDVTLENGNTYDQVLMTGSTLTVGADTVDGVHQVTRVDFLDANGDIVRAEFSGAGSLQIDLAGFVAAAAPEHYNTETQYVQGLATFTITGSDETTNFSVFSLGSENVWKGADSALFEGDDHSGGNNVADVALLVIQDNGSVLGNAFGRIGAGNAVFSADTGAVGILAPKIQFQGDIIIGDIAATDIASPVLQIGEFSSNKTVTVAGGDLKQPDGVGLNDDNSVSKLISTSGTTSMGTNVETQIIAANIVNAEDITYKSSADKVVIDGTTATQEQLDAYKDKFLDEVEIQGGLAEGLTFAARMMGNVTVTGDLAGLITTDVDGDDVSDTNELGIANVEVTGNIVAGGAIESSTSIGNVLVGGGIDFTDVDGAKNDEAAAIISTLGRDDFSAKIGDISFGEAVNLDNENLALVVSSVLTPGGATAVGIGKVTIVGDFTSSDAGSIIEAKEGAVGNIDVDGDLDVDMITAAAGIGSIEANDIVLGDLAGGTEGIGAITSLDGDISLAGLDADKALGNITSDGDLAFNGVVSAKSIGNIEAGGKLEVKAGATIDSTDGNIGTLKASDGILSILDTVTATGGSIGAITATKGNVTIGAALDGAKGVGKITASKGDIAITDTITAGGGAFGGLSATAGDITIGAAITADSIGAISVTADGATGGNLSVFAAVTADNGGIGDITLTGEDDAVKLDFNDVADGSFSATSTIGKITINGGSIEGADGQVEFAANQIGDVKVVGHADDTVLLTDVIFRAGTTAAFDDGAEKKSAVGSAQIGNIELDASAGTLAAIAASTSASTSATTGTGFSSAGKIGNITLTTADDGKLLAADDDVLLFRAGSQLMGEATDTGADATATYNLGSDADGGVSIGNVTISTQLDQALSDGTAGTGLIIASGVNLGTDGQFVTVPDDADANDAVEDALLAPAKMGSNNTIGAVVLQDLSGASSFNGFVSATLLTEGSQAGPTYGSVIVADKIGSISLATGAGTVLDLTALNGLPLKGVVGTVGEADAANGDDTADIFVVVL